MPQFIFEEEREIFPILIPFFSILQYPYNDDDKNSSLSYICKYIIEFFTSAVILVFRSFFREIDF